MTRRVVVTSALPYANGSIHLGHLVEYIYTDTWVRFLKMTGAEAHYFCADDTHGTPIQIRALKEGVTPETLVARFHAEHTRDFGDFEIEFTRYHSTHSEENRVWSARIYEAARAAGHIARRPVEQTYCPNDKMFLPDRFVRGTCPKCGAEDQYGDVCEVCNTAYAPTELKSPRCAICGTPPERRSSEHLFFELAKLTDRLRAWTNEPGHLQPEVANFTRGWIEGGLRDWDISRDGPYFGFPIPGEENKFFYVWLDAPIGYIATTQAWCDANGKDVRDYWQSPDTEIYHFIGKDIVYFHCLFWPAMLMDAGLSLPTSVCVHGFLTVEGQKMSKTRGTFLNARTYLDHLDPQYLRYYYGTKLSGRVEDLDLSFDDFINRVNAELVNKVANLASRAISFVAKRLDHKLGRIPADGAALVEQAAAAVQKAHDAYQRRDVAGAVQQAIQLAEAGNLYMQEAAPWDALKSDPERARDICTLAVNLTKVVAVILRPLLPGLADRVAEMLRVAPFTWADAKADLEDHEIGEFTHLVQRVEREKVDAMIEDAKALAPAPAAQPAAPAEPAYTVEPLTETCTIDDFGKVDLRVARVLAAAPVEGAKKLVHLTLDLGPLGERSVFAGIREAYPEPGVLVGKTLVCCANLAPRQMRFGLSEGMVLAAGEGARVYPLELPGAARPGDRIH